MTDYIDSIENKKISTFTHKGFIILMAKKLFINISNTWISETPV